MIFKKRTASLLLSTCAFFLLLPAAKDGCGSDDPVSIGDDAGEGGAGDGGAGEGGAGPDIQQQATFGECVENQDAEYCEAEVLAWSYDEATESLTLLDKRLELNCCGERSWIIEQQGDGYVATQTDAPENVGGEPARCGCMCVFDFTLVADPIPAGPIDLTIVREVTDDNEGASTVFDGTLDLTEGSGEIVVDDSPATFCGDQT
jgi:hypothetical protein